MSAPAGDGAGPGPGRRPGEPPGALRGLRVAVRRLRRGRGRQHRGVHARPGRHLLRGQRRDRQVDQLEPERHLGQHCLPGLAVHLLRLLLGGERQDLRHGAARGAGRTVRWRRCRRATGGGAHAGTPVELPGFRPRLP